MEKILEKSPYFVFLALGYFLGRITLSKPQKIDTETHTESILARNSQVLVQATSDKRSNLSQETIVVKKSYSPNGKLKSETQTTSKSVEVSQEESKVDKSQEVHLLAFDYSDKKTETSYQYDWLVGLSIPVDTMIDPSGYRVSSLKATVAYRVLGSSYVFVQSNYQLKTAEVGFLFPL